MSSDAPRVAGADRHEITDALVALNGGSPDAMDRLMPLVYRELKRIAHRQLGSEAGGHTLSTTAVVHEAFLRLTRQSRVEWVDRGQFFAIAARIMRRVLIDYARRHQAVRRGGDQRVAVAVEILEHGDDSLARVVECRFFAGLNEAETAEALGVSQRTVSRDWQMARAWLHEALSDDATARA
jgi:DNA-directed RNA polymerase specialized sigma24 family protein